MRKHLRSALLFVVAVVVLAVVLVTIGFKQPKVEAGPETIGSSSLAAVMPTGRTVVITPPLGLPPVPTPADNPPTEETIALGRRLYYDPALSLDGTISCASCHAPQLGFADNVAFSKGVGGKLGGRNAPTVINSAYNTLQFWDGRAPSLEKQAEGPMANPVEMAHTLNGVAQRVSADSQYRDLFREAWGTDQITIDLVTKSIASFERTVLSGDSPFDRYFYLHDATALSPAAQRGLLVFMNPRKGNCAVCHSIGKDSSLFTDNKFHNIGVGLDRNGDLKDLGRYDQTRSEADRGAFKTPTLRNIAQTAPYMHDGSLKTLKEVIDHYVGGGSSNPHLDKEIHALDFLTFQERADLLAFLNSLTGKLPANVGPPPDLAQTSLRPAN
jgi:cytochrome c peroxidase